MHIDLSKVKNKESISTDINGYPIELNPVRPERLPVLYKKIMEAKADYVKFNYKKKAEPPIISPSKLKELIAEN